MVSLSLLTGIVTIIFPACKMEIPFLATSHKQVIHSAESNSPYSLLDGTTIRIQPYNAIFNIPESWLTLKPSPNKHVKNLFLSLQELNEVNRIDGEHNGLNKEDAEVINSVLGFEDCAAHVGDRGWGNALWNDLQGRIYVTDLSPEETAARIEKQGLEKALQVFERASVKSGKHGKWQMRTLDILDAPTHFMLYKSLDFYYRTFGNKTVVIVFLRANKFDEEINLILDSFTWPNEH